MNYRPSYTSNWRSSLVPATGSTPKAPDTEPWVVPESVRVIVIGASLMSAMVGSGRLQNILDAAYPGVFTAIRWATAGHSPEEIRDDTITNLAGISPADPYDKHVFIIYSGGQIVSTSRPYDTITQLERDRFDAVLETRTAITDAGFSQEDVHIVPLTFRPYSGDVAYLDESQGSFPYLAEFYDPYYEAAVTHPDGRHFFDLYTLLFNNAIDWIGNDNLHPTQDGYDGMAEFFRDTMARYYMTGLSPVPLVKETFSDPSPIPADLAATPGSEEVALTWSQSELTRSYKIYRDGVLVQTVAHPTTEWTDTGLTNGVEYDYTISSSNDGGDSAQSAVVSATPESAVPTFGNASREFVSPDYIDTGSETIANGVFADTGTPYTVAFWARLDAYNATFVSKSGGSPANRAFHMFNISGTGLGITLRGDNNNNAVAGVFDTLGVWKHIALVWSGSGTTADVYIDGVFADTKSVGTSAEEVGERIIIGARTNGTGYWMVDGNMADVRFYSRELTAGEVADLHSGVHVTGDLDAWYLADPDSLEDFSGNEPDATNSGTAYSTEGPFG